MSRELAAWSLTTVAKVVKTFGCIEDSAETLDEFRYGEGGFATGGRRLRHGGRRFRCEILRYRLSMAVLIDTGVTELAVGR